MQEALEVQERVGKCREPLEMQEKRCFKRAAGLLCLVDVAVGVSGLSCLDAETGLALVLLLSLLCPFQRGLTGRCTARQDTAVIRGAVLAFNVKFAFRCRVTAQACLPSSPNEINDLF